MSVPTTNTDRYHICWHPQWETFFIEDQFTMEPVAMSEKEEDAKVICECLNVIDYERGWA